MWGIATSAYQIEGGTTADGRGESIWDVFARTPGNIEGGHDASVACDHYARRDDDVRLIHDLGVDSYRFSIAWPRIQPSGEGPVNERGMAFYDRLIDLLLDAGIRPFPTLYHWDLPQALEDRGGWANRETASRYADYAALVTRTIGDRIDAISLFNEPFIFTSRGYLLGRYAPGRRSSRDYVRAVHTVNMAAAEGLRAVKAERPALAVGSVFAMSPCEPATTRAEDAEAASYADTVFNRLFVDPLMTGRYPEAFLQSVDARALGQLPDDASRMLAPLDFIGVNCYYRLIVSAGGHDRPELPWFLFDVRSDVRGTGGHADMSTPTEDGPSAVPTPTERRIHNAFGRGDGKRTAMGWEIWPDALHDVLLMLRDRYPGVPIEVCESGCAFDERPDETGAVNDVARIEYHRAHIEAVERAIRHGAPVRSYHAWSLYDNFEWASGYRPRFGLVHVDFASQQRTLKASGHWYRALCHAAHARRAR
jgi:beta-glucosidase